MSEKKETRLRRARKARLKMRELEVVRLCVYRSSQHIYAQVISADGGKVLASASTLDKELRDGATGNVEAAKKVGQLVAERAKRWCHPGGVRSFWLQVPRPRPGAG